ncbi:kinase-like domain-containing protein [Rhizophagus diaphanus]|nr:kinase-like domain-containing protein [Rhizophagus diaphanus] [Rhizophagus sp. MUCL 43196]
MLNFELEGEAKERYTIVRSYNYGNELNVYKVHKKNDPETHYMLKSYKTREDFERESQMLRELYGAKNIVQMIDVYPLQSIIVCESALYDLEIFLHHQNNIQRQEEKGNIIKDVVSGLSELQKHNIVHVNLSPKNIMYFQEKDGYTESWKLIDFDTACFIGSYFLHHAKIKMNYSAPEVIEAYDKEIEIKVDFAMDMFSFGLILYFLEIGHHYWDGENEEKKEKIISTKYLPLRNIDDPTACYIIKSLLDKRIPHRMTLEGFIKTSYYISGSSKQKDESAIIISLTLINSEPKNTNNSKFESDNEINEEKFPAKSTQEVQENYHNEIFNILNKNIMLDSISCQNSISSYNEFNEFYNKSLTDLLEYIFKILSEVIENANASGKKHFRKNDFMEIAQKLREHYYGFKLQINDVQKIQFISILKNQNIPKFIPLSNFPHLSILVKDYTLTNKMYFLSQDIIEIRSIMKAGELFNNHLSKLAMALNSRDNKKIQYELNRFADDNINSDEDTDMITLSRWYHFETQALETPKEIKPREEIFVKSKRLLNDIIVTGKSLKYLNHETILCVIKEIILYNDNHFNDNDYIIKFHGYSIINCECHMYYDYVDYNLFEYFQSNHNSSEPIHLSNWKNKIKLAWEISVGVKYLHDQKIVHLDLRSENILLKYDEKEETMIPKISNFLWSKEIYSGKTSAYPIITLSSGEEVWKRWYDPDRLCGNEPSTPSDIYSLGLLFWEIIWCKPENLPFKDVPIENLYNHLLNNHYEELPELPRVYRDWGNIIKNMWKFKAEDRYDIIIAESNMRKLSKKIPVDKGWNRLMIDINLID